MNRHPALSHHPPHTQLPDLSKLERESRRYLYLGFVFGVIVHAFAGLFISYDGIVPVSRQSSITALPAELIELPPRRLNPYRDWRPQNTPRSYVRRRGTAPVLPDISTSAPQRLSHGPGRFTAVDRHTTSALIDEQVTDVYTDSINVRDYTLMVHDNRIPLKYPVFFDTGDYKTEIVFNPNDRQSIQGYVHFGIGWGKYLHPSDKLSQSVKHLADIISRHTNIEAVVDRQVYLAPYLPDDIEDRTYARRKPGYASIMAEYNAGRVFLSPYAFLFITTDRVFSLTLEEKNNLGIYLDSGGFLILDNGAAGYDDGQVDRCIRTMFLVVLPLDHSHPVYHCFYDIDEPPQSTVAENRPDFDTVFGIFQYTGTPRPGKLVGIYTPQGYSRSWYDPKNTEQIKMGVNLVVYALTKYDKIVGRIGSGSKLVSGGRYLRR